MPAAPWCLCARLVGWLRASQARALWSRSQLAQTLVGSHLLSKLGKETLNMFTFVTDSAVSAAQPLACPGSPWVSRQPGPW